MDPIWNPLKVEMFDVGVELVLLSIIGGSTGGRGLVWLPELSVELSTGGTTITGGSVSVWLVFVLLSTGGLTITGGSGFVVLPGTGGHSCAVLLPLK